MVTTVLDLLGALLLVVALAVLVWPASVAGAFGAAGAGVLVLSWVIDRKGGKP